MGCPGRLFTTSPQEPVYKITPKKASAGRSFGGYFIKKTVSFTGFPLLSLTENHQLEKVLI